MPNTSILVAGEAVPNNSRLIMGTDQHEITYCLTAGDLRPLSMTELRALMDLLVTVDDVICGLINQPRFAEGVSANAAGAIVDDLSDYFSSCIALLEQVAKEATPRSQEEATVRAWLLLHRAARYSEKLLDFAAMATELNISVSEMEAV